MTLAEAILKAPTLSLWPRGNPGGWSRPDAEETIRPKGDDFVVVRNVSAPTLQLFVAARAKYGAPVVIVLPGGGYVVEAIEHEGWEIAHRLNREGVHAAVLKYRLPNRDADKPLHKAPLQDAQRAIRLLRAWGEEHGLAPERVGLLGFSAGGHLAAVASDATRSSYAWVDDADRRSARPDFTGLVYPAYLATSNGFKLTDGLKVSTDAPPAFIVQTMDDSVGVENALAYADTCRKAGVSAEMHVFPKGGHGYGLRSKEPGLSRWMDLYVDWLRHGPPS